MPKTRQCPWCGGIEGDHWRTCEAPKQMSPGIVAHVKVCPIPDCGGLGRYGFSAGVNNPEVECQECGFTCYHDDWDKLLRPEQLRITDNRTEMVQRSCPDACDSAVHLRTLVETLKEVTGCPGGDLVEHIQNIVKIAESAIGGPVGEK